MNSKYKNFLITNYIVLAFILLVSISFNNIILIEFGYNENFIALFIASIIGCSLYLYYYLSKSSLSELFKSDEDIDNMLKKTLHELNTPVATIQMNSKMLEKNINNDKDKKRLERIKSSCENLLTLYDNMEYTISSSIDKIELKKFDIKTLSDTCISKVEDVKGNIIIHNNITSQFITSDIFGFEIMLDNLISNAIKYNNKNGQIILQNNNNILSIQDTGFGIDTKNIFKVYDRYYQEDINAKGMGLGLNIVKEFCDKNKINIKIDTQENIGTTFNLNYSLLI